MAASALAGCGSQARGHGTCQSYDLGLTASLTLICRPGIQVTVFFLELQQDGDAQCWAVCNAGHKIWPAKAGPGEEHCNNLKCLTSEWRVFSCYAAAMMIAMK